MGVKGIPGIQHLKAIKAFYRGVRPSAGSGQAALANLRPNRRVNLIQGENGSCKSVKSNFRQDQQDLQDFLGDKSLNAEGRPSTRLGAGRQARW